MTKQSTFQGGPLDGQPVEPSAWDFDSHTFDVGGDRVALYEATVTGDAFHFTGIYDASELRNSDYVPPAGVDHQWTDDPDDVRQPCVFCGERLNPSQSTNPWPVAELPSVCCSMCNAKFVIPTRIRVQEHYTQRAEG